MSKNNCPFCNMNNKATIINETENTFTILSNLALVKGHCLVILKKHAERLAELGFNERAELFSQIIKLQERLLKKFPGCDIRQNFRPFQKQDDLKINHLHIHLQPREFEDELYKNCQIFEKDIFKNLNQNELNEIKDFILK